MLAQMYKNIASAVDDLDDVWLKDPDPNRPALLRLVSNRPAGVIINELVDCIEKHGLRVVYFVHGPGPQPWTRIRLLDWENPDEHHVVSISYAAPPNRMLTWT